MNVKNRTMPYELNKGETQQVYDRWMAKCKEELSREKTSYRRFSQNIQAIVQDFEAIPIDENMWKPKVGIVGEILAKYHPVANNNIEKVLMEVAEGRGEKLTVLKPAPRFFVAACKPDFPISTPALFARVDGVTITDRPDTDAMLAAIEHGDADTLCANVRNVFEQALDGEQRERIETIKCDLLAYGAKTSAMTGSGSVVFGLFSDKAACRRACEALQGECVKTFCAEFV